MFRVFVLFNAVSIKYECRFFSLDERHMIDSDRMKKKSRHLQNMYFNYFQSTQWMSFYKQAFSSQGHIFPHAHSTRTHQVQNTDPFWPQTDAVTIGLYRFPSSQGRSFKKGQSTHSQSNHKQRNPGAVSFCTKTFKRKNLVCVVGIRAHSVTAEPAKKGESFEFFEGKATLRHRSPSDVYV